MNLKNQCLRTGAYILLDNLVQNGVEHIFGYPGGAILPIYDELYYWEKENLIKHILVRHEQSAAHAADAYARTTNKVGVCFATSGPGATNLVTGIANARMDSIPMIIITGQVGRSFIGTDAFQETDIFGITLPIVKHSYTVRDTNLLPEIISEAFFLAQNGRPGPILIDIPKDVGLEESNFYSYTKFNQLTSITGSSSFSDSITNLKGKIELLAKFEHSTNLSNINKLILYLTESYQPLFYLGGGIIRSNNFKCIQQIAKLFQIPVTTTLMGKSSYNETDNLALGMLGMHGTAYANFAVSECDLLLAIGARFDDRVTGKLDEFACDAEVIHLDIDPAEISKNRSPQLGIIGDSRKILLEMLKRLRYEKPTNSGNSSISSISLSRNGNILQKNKEKNLEKNLIKESWISEIFEKNNNQTQSWLKRIIQWKDAYPLISNNYESYHTKKSEDIKNIKERTISLSPQETISFIGKKYQHSFFTTDVGQHQMWAAQLINCEPKKWVSSSGLGTMGFGLPSAIGAKIANSEQFVVCISGDSSFQMSIQELGTISQYRLGIKMVIINNGWQGMVRQWQQSFYGNRFSNSYMRNGMPNFAEVAKAYNIEGFSIQNIEMLEKIIEFDLKRIENLPILLDINVVENENCYPMVAPGRSNSQMLGITKQEELKEL